MKAPQRPPLAVGTVHFAGEGVAVVVARSAAEARDAAELVEVDYDDRSTRCSTWRRRSPRAPRSCHPDLGTNENATWVFDSGAAGTGGSVDEAIAAAEADPDSVVVTPPLPPAAADPGVHGAALLRGRPDRRAAHDLGRHPGPAHPAHDDRGHPRRAGGQDPRDRPGRGRRLRRQDRACCPRRCSASLVAQKLRQAGEVDRDPLGVAAGRPPRPRPDPGHTITAKTDGTVTGLDVAPARRHGRLPRPRRAGRADPRRVHVQRDLQDPGLPVHLHERVHHQDAHRRLPRRRAAGGDVRDRADRWTSSPSSSAATRWSCASRTGSSTRSSRSPRSRA